MDVAKLLSFTPNMTIWNS